MLPRVLWASHSSTGETQFSSVYNIKVVISAKVAVPTFQIAYRELEKNDALRRQSLDSAEEKLDQVLIRRIIYQQHVAKYYNTWVRHRSLKVGELILQKVFQNTQNLNSGKLNTT